MSSPLYLAFSMYALRKYTLFTPLKTRQGMKKTIPNATHESRVLHFFFFSIQNLPRLLINAPPPLRQYLRRWHPLPAHRARYLFKSDFIETYASRDNNRSCVVGRIFSRADDICAFLALRRFLLENLSHPVHQRRFLWSSACSAHTWPNCPWHTIYSLYSGPVVFGIINRSVWKIFAPPRRYRHLRVRFYGIADVARKMCPACLQCNLQGHAGGGVFFGWFRVICISSGMSRDFNFEGFAGDCFGSEALRFLRWHQGWIDNLSFVLQS